MDYCVSTALDTANILARCMRNYPNANTLPPGPAGNNDPRALFASCAGSLLCTHIWRCTLLLLFRQEFASALACVQALASIGDIRTVNAACGRYLSFFLRRLLCRLRLGDNIDLERDEEMMAYVSGDMQGTSDGSWVWHGSETGSQLEAMSPMRSTSVSRGQPGPAQHERDAEWEGWEWIEKTVQELFAEQRQRAYTQRDTPMGGQSRQEGPVPSGSTLAPEFAGSDSERRSSSAHSRMTIASII
jgi:hypothetical protein